MSDRWLERGESSITELLRRTAPRGITVRATGRVYRWKFDHVEARERVAAGEGIAAVARSLGVSYNAVARVVDPRVNARMAERSKASYRGRCEACGAPCLAANHPSKRSRGGPIRAMCRSCADRQRIRRVRFDPSGAVLEVRCGRCERWLPLGEFGGGRGLRRVRDGGVSGRCRTCASAARRSYRERHLEPCADCGAPVEGKGRANHGRDADRPYLCQPCSMRRVRAVRRERKAGLSSRSGLGSGEPHS